MFHFSLKQLLKINPKRPLQSFKYQIIALKACGLWPPTDTTMKKYYEIYSKIVLYLWFILVFSSFMAIFEVQSVEVCIKRTDILYFINIPLNFY